ncbi:hypothetical protein [Streptomyces sp. NBC_01497]|uniref:hypothetical protein n=1 Tax=Streptomyces sp. NBC_01497 TaxID=2903885 RepID=UPI002E333BA5|nr:hypothetical protein [Streptomyces sp. NBC_01497]
MAITSSTARTTLAVALTVLCGGQLATGTARADGQETGTPTYGLSLISIDNSGADSWLEVDRTLNVLGPLSKGTAGSDHDGGGGAVEQYVSGSSTVGLQAAPQHRDGDEEEGEQADSAACGGDDPEGDADHDTPAPRRHSGACGPAQAASAPRNAQE